MLSIGHAAHWQGIEERVVISWFACLCIRSKLRSSSLTVIFNTKLRVFSLLSLVPLCLFTVQGVRGGWCTPVNKQRSCSSMSWVRYTSMKFREIRDTSAKYVPLFCSCLTIQMRRFVVWTCATKLALRQCILLPRCNIQWRPSPNTISYWMIDSLK